MKKHNITFALIFAMAISIFSAVLPAKSHAGFEGLYSEAITITSGTLATSVTLAFPRTNIRDVYLFCPTLDADSTATLSMTTSLFPDISAAAGTIAPNGWTDKAIGATDDGAIIKCLSAVTNIFVDGDTVWTLTAADAQGAPRVFYLFILREI